MAILVDPFALKPEALVEARELQASGASVHKVWVMLQQTHGIVIHERTLRRRLKRDRTTYNPVAAGAPVYEGSAATRAVHLQEAKLSPQEVANAPAVLFRLMGALADEETKKKKKSVVYVLGLRRLQLEWFKAAAKPGSDEEEELDGDAKARLAAKIKELTPVTDGTDGTDALEGGEEAGDDAPQDAARAADGE